MAEQYNAAVFGYGTEEALDLFGLTIRLLARGTRRFVAVYPSDGPNFACVLGSGA